jgi:cobalamin-dependent methionine synthase I
VRRSTRGAQWPAIVIADFFRDVAEGERDVIGLQVVTMGRRASEAAREWFAQNRYQDYLYLHGLSVEMAEAFAEYLHKRIRGELGFAAEEARDPETMLNQGYRGSRYSFGYPPAPTSPTKSNYWRCCAPRRSASRSPKRTSSTPSNRPPRSSSTTPRRNTSRCDASPPAGL